MEWIIFVFLAALFWMSCNIFSKILLSRHVKNAVVYAVLVGFAGLITLTLIPFNGLSMPSLPILALTMLTGALYIYAMLPYFMSLMIEEVSRVMPLWKLKPLFVLLFAVAFLGESLNTFQLIAFFLLLFGGFMISVRRIEGVFKISRAFSLMMLSSVIFGAYHTLTKFVYMNMAYYDGFILLRVGSFLGAASLLALPRHRKALSEALNSMGWKVKGAVAGYELLNLGGLAFFNYAVSVGPVSLVTAAIGIQPVLLLITASLLSSRYPGLLKESMSRGAIIQKTLAVILLVVGAGIVVLY
ncbi:MAG: EamA family transporter [Candidatus Woesearchaeota archaeon]